MWNMGFAIFVLQMSCSGDFPKTIQPASCWAWSLNQFCLFLNPETLLLRLFDKWLIIWMYFVPCVKRISISERKHFTLVPRKSLTKFYSSFSLPASKLFPLNATERLAIENYFWYVTYSKINMVQHHWKYLIYLHLFLL